jgi:hypothetical protein
MTQVIDWELLARELDTFSDDETGARTERGNNSLARQALERIIGPEHFVEAVEHYLYLRPGFELARSVLWVVRPWSAMLRCRRVFETDPDLRRRQRAVELLRVLADQRALPWIADFLADPDPGIQLMGAHVLDQLVFSSLVREHDCTELLDRAGRHPNASVREVASAIRARFAEA